MSGVDLRVALQDAGVAARLARAATVIGNLLPLMEEIGASLETSTRMRFERGAGPDGGAWRPSRRGGKTLVDTGRLLASMTHNASRDHVEVGSNVIYAAIHQFGGRTGRGLAVDMPARPFLGLDADDEREIDDLISDYLREAFR